MEKFFKDEIYNFNYENVVKFINKKINFVFDFHWDENCLNLTHENKSSIKTASINQARKPIYQTLSTPIIIQKIF